jgi:hypothetical protein
MSLSVNDRGRLGYPAAGSPREAGGMSLPHLAGHRSVAFRFTWVEPMNIERVSVGRALDLARAGVLKELKQNFVRSMYQVEV